VAFRRALRYFNIAILVALVAGLAAVYWFAYRPLPQVSGTVKAPVSGRAVIARDALGVPHITAASVEDALVLQGYVTAQDRLWQMDGLRRVAAGRLSEIVGPAALEADREARLFRLERIAERHQAGLSASDRAALAAYARGVNAFIAAHRNRLPLEFTLLGYDPRPWTIQDSLLVCLYIYRNLTTSWRNDLVKAALLDGGDRGKVDFLFSAKQSGGVAPGSNAWALAGSRTASRRPLLANDPHLEYSLPGVWYAIHLKAPGLNVSGAALPGAPGVILGHNERIGWGVTNLEFDVQDLYIERLNPQTGAYLFAGKLEQARMERETILVKGAAPVESAVWITRHGPAFRQGDQFVALRWTAAEADFAFPLLDVSRAGNFQEFTAALARYPGPALNFVYADVDGNIGFQVAGRLPIRRAFDGGAPVDGSLGEYEWDGFIPFEQLPRVYNPASGMIVTANHNPFPADYPYRVSGKFASPYRAVQIGNLLDARKNWRADDMVTVQKDVYSTFYHFLARQVVAAYDRRGVASPGLADAVRSLRSWNGQMESGPAPVVATLVFQHLRQAVAERASPGKGSSYDAPGAVGLGNTPVSLVAIETLFRERPKDWFGDYDQLLLRCFLDAIEEGRRMQGHDMTKWDYGKHNQLHITHPVLSRLPLIRNYFSIGPLAQSGSGSSVKQTTRRLGPSMRMAVDFANLDDSRLNLLAGESGQALSEHYKDQFEAWYYGRSFPMQFVKVEAKDTLVVEPE